MKWANGDKIQALLQQKPSLEPLLVAHLQEIEAAMAPPPAPMQPQPYLQGMGNPNDRG